MEHLSPEFLTARQRGHGNVNVSGQPSWELGCIMLEMILGDFPFLFNGPIPVADELTRDYVWTACHKCNPPGALSDAVVHRIADLLCSLVEVDPVNRCRIQGAVEALRQCSL
tara:strand:- start:9739 stop:10074 length:336 start_codon:yes stop_codon:yes gene_type:complete